MTALNDKTQAPTKGDSAGLIAEARIVQGSEHVTIKGAQAFIDLLATALEAAEARAVEAERERDKARRVVSEIDSALCEFTNGCSDDFTPVSQWDAEAKKNFERLCKAYNDWHENHDIDANNFWRERAETAERQLAAAREVVRQCACECVDLSECPDGLNCAGWIAKTTIEDGAR